nr:histidine kinase [Lihuaxuella thermophila]
MRIRTKMIAYSMILVFLLNSIAFFLYHNSQKSIDQYNGILQRFFLLNEISQRTGNVYRSLNAYLIERSPEHFLRYQQERQELVVQQSRLKHTLMQQNITVKNYQNLITSFLEECTAVVKYFEKQQLPAYSSHLAEASKISRFIQETTLTLIDGELTNYRAFYRDMNQQQEYFRAMGIAVFASTILFSILFALWFSSGITKPITLLSKAAKEISLGHLGGEEVRVSTNDELRFLTETFNRMRFNIRCLVEEIKKKSELDKLIKEMELKNLQNQINPHFLFNTLNTVSKMAYIEGAEKTSDLIDSVSAILRYHLGDLDKPSTLHEEVKVVEEYFFIQKTRFGDRINFKTNVEPDCLSLPVPSLTLQPLVENAFIHGIESYESGAMLMLNIFYKHGRIIVEVSDNGVGMDEETKRRLLNKEEDHGAGEAGRKRSGHSTGIGLKNVIKRLELFYDQENLVEIESEPGKGTIVRLILPAEREKEVAERDHV